MTDELEEMAREIVLWLYGPDEGLSEGLVRTLKDKIVNALKTLRSKTRKEDAEVAKKWFVDFSDADKHDGDCVDEPQTCMLCMAEELSHAILKKDEEESR